MVYNIIVDILLVLLFALGGFLGFRKGFFYTATKPIKWLAAFILAFTLSTTVATNIIVPLINEPITNQISEFLVEKCADITPENLEDKLPTLIKIAAEFANVDITMLEGEGAAELIQKIVDTLSGPVIYLISMVISFFIVYLISKLLLAIIFWFLNLIFKSGVLGVVNKILGTVLGMFIAFSAMWSLIVAFEYILNIPAVANTAFAKAFDGGWVYGFIKSMSPVDLLLSF